MHLDCNERRQTTYDERSRNTKSKKLRSGGEKETYKSLGILEVDTIKQVEMKEKKLKSVSQKN